MRLNEINVIDLAERAYFGLHEMLKQAKLLENNNNYQLYSTAIDNEKSNLGNLIPSHIYYPLYLYSAPVAEYIKGEYTSKELIYKHTSDNKEIFEDNNGKMFQFPQNKDMGDGRIDLFPYTSKIDRDHFLSILKIKFSSWKIKIDKV